MSDPNKIVAERIVEALEKDDVLLPASTKGLADKLAAGRLGASDWITLVWSDEKSREQNGKDETK